MQSSAAPREQAHPTLRESSPSIRQVVRRAGQPGSELRYLRVEFAGGRGGVGGEVRRNRFAWCGCPNSHRPCSGPCIGRRRARVPRRKRPIAAIASQARPIHDSVTWSKGWRGSAQYLYVQQGPRGGSGMRGAAQGAGTLAFPQFYNVTSGRRPVQHRIDRSIRQTMNGRPGRPSCSRMGQGSPRGT